MSITRLPLLGAAVGLFSLLALARPAEAQAPQVIASDPADGATGVPPSVSPRVTFSEAMDPASIDANTCTLAEASEYPRLIVSYPLSSLEAAPSVDTAAPCAVARDARFDGGPSPGGSAREAVNRTGGSSYPSFRKSCRCAASSSVRCQ